MSIHVYSFAGLIGLFHQSSRFRTLLIKYRQTAEYLKRQSSPLLCLLCGVVLSCGAVSRAQAADYFIREIISVHPGEQVTRGITVSSIFSLSDFEPIEAFIVYSWGYDVPAGDLTIEVDCLADQEFNQRIGFRLIVAGYRVKQPPVVRGGHARFPEAIVETIPVQSTFGIYYVGVLVSRILGEVDLPIPFGITFSVSEGSAP